MSRSLESRVSRLEQGSVADPDRIFVIGCGSDEDEDHTMQAAVDKGLLVLDENGWWPRGMALCCRWQGERPTPEPRWLTTEDATDDELTSILDSVRARLLREGSVTPQEYDEMERDPDAYLASLRVGVK
jgi:hypothetical protein